MIHILVVDDDVKLNKTVCTYLNDCGFEAKGVLDAQLAFEEMYNNLYDLIVSDIISQLVIITKFLLSILSQKSMKIIRVKAKQYHDILSSFISKENSLMFYKM